MFSNGRPAAAFPPSAFAVSISTSPGSRVSHRGSTTGCPTVRTLKPTPGSGTSSTHRSNVVWLGRIKSAITDDSSRNDAKLAMNGTLASAARNLSDSGSVNIGFVSSTRSALILLLPMALISVWISTADCGVWAPGFAPEAGEPAAAGTGPLPSPASKRIPPGRP